jgi:hypothetical protein
LYWVKYKRWARAERWNRYIACSLQLARVGCLINIKPATNITTRTRAEMVREHYAVAGRYGAGDRYTAISTYRVQETGVWIGVRSWNTRTRAEMVREQNAVAGVKVQ